MAEEPVVKGNKGPVANAAPAAVVVGDFTIDDVGKYVGIAKELLGVALVFLPDGKAKDKVKQVEDLLGKDVVLAAVKANVDLFNEVKAIVVSK